MASSARMMTVGIVWAVGMFTLIVMAFLGSVILNPILDWFLAQPIHPALAESGGAMWWFMPLYYGIIVIMAIVLTYVCYAQTVVTTDYYPDQGGY
jgi:hypothetical protein